MTSVTDAWLADATATYEAEVAWARERGIALRQAVEVARSPFDPRDRPTAHALEAMIWRFVDTAERGGSGSRGFGKEARAKLEHRFAEHRDQISRLMGFDHSYQPSWQKPSRPEPKDRIAPGSIGVAIENALTRIALYEQGIAALQFAVNGLPLQGGVDNDAYSDFTKIYDRLGRYLHDATGDLFKLAILVPEATRSARLREALRHYTTREFDEPRSIMHPLNARGEMPPMWASDDENRFRSALRRAIKKL